MQELDYREKLPPLRATRAVIHLNNLKHNIRLIREKVGDDVKICLPVKANAYGHGVVTIAKAACSFGVEYLAVAAVSEGEQLRKNGLKGPIILLNHVLPEETEGLIAQNLIPVAGSCAYLDLLAASACRIGVSLPVHLKVDTGMGRLGCAPDEVLVLARHIQKKESLELTGLCTHFPSADSSLPEDRVFTLEQIEIVREITDKLKECGIDPGLIHTANSGGIATLPASSFDMVRPGIALYGYEPVEDMPLGVKPVMELETRVLFLKKIKKGQSVSYGRTWTAAEDSVIATLPVGYGDGYNRLLSNQGKVLINGRLYPIVGRICMDQCMVDVGNDGAVKLYDKAVLFGPDPSGPSAADIAKQINTIPYEVTCSISPRVPRIYVKQEIS